MSRRKSNTVPAAPAEPPVEMDPTEVEEEVEEEEEEENGMEYESETSTQSGTDSLTWISWFCSLPGHEYFAEVSEDFIEDDFNLTGLNALVPFYKEALDMVLDVEPEEEQLKIPDVSIVESSAELLYGLIHQRFIITRQGLQQMVEKYESAHFGHCARVYCNGCKLLPCGRSDLPGVDTVKLFCPSCIDIYAPPSSRFSGVDGAFFGTTFPHLLFQSYKELLPSAPASTSTAPALATSAVPTSPPVGTGAASRASSLGITDAPQPKSTPIDPASLSIFPATTPLTSTAKVYIPRIYGFKVSELARSGPRMQWMRMKPRNPKEVKTINSYGWFIGLPESDDEEEDEEESSESEGAEVAVGKENVQKKPAKAERGATKDEDSVMAQVVS